MHNCHVVIIIRTVCTVAVVVVVGVATLTCVQIVAGGVSKTLGVVHTLLVVSGSVATCSTSAQP